MNIPKLIIDQGLEIQFRESIEYLNSDEAIKSVERDPYWPKWNSPWWHMALLYEMGCSSFIPDHVLQRIIDMMNTHYLRFFPIYEQELPESINPYTRIPCHCQLGNIYQIIRSKRSDVDEVLPWIRPWFLRYQLPDGGLNCEEDAYRVSQKSSIASSLPVFEAMMMCAEDSVLSDAEEAFLDRAAAYIIEHRLLHKLSGAVMNEAFLKLQFPRFYSYDILRGLSFLARWKKYRNTTEADEVIAYGISLLKEKSADAMLFVECSELIDTKTRAIDKAGEWTIVEPASIFPLLNAVNGIGKASGFLTREFEQVLMLYND